VTAAVRWPAKTSMARAWFAIGINSFVFIDSSGFYCGQSIVTRLSYHVSWLQQTMNRYP